MDTKLEHRLEDAGYETIEPLPGEEQPPPKRLTLSPINRRRLENFKRNKRGYWSFWIFLVLFGLSLLANVIANDRPMVVSYKGEILFPVLVNYPESKFGGFLATTDYRDPFVQRRDQRQRLDGVAADPLLLRHGQQRDPDTGAGAAVVDDDAGRALRRLSAGRQRP